MKTIQTGRGVNRQYFLWLCQIVEADSDDRKIELCWWLHSKDFTWFVPNDDNRVEDGIYLRITFGRDKLRMDTPCTVLEMLIALAYRMNYQVETVTIAECFWDFIRNLELDNSPFVNSRENEYKLRRFLSREYAYDGRGGIFPLRNPAQDQRNVELWYQMMSYIQQ